MISSTKKKSTAREKRYKQVERGKKEKLYLRLGEL